MTKFVKIWAFYWQLLANSIGFDIINGPFLQIDLLSPDVEMLLVSFRPDCLLVGSIVEFFSLDCLLVGSEFNCPNSNQSHCCCQFIGNLWFISARLYFTFILNEILKYQAQVIITNYIHVWRKEFLWWFLGNSVVGTVMFKTNCITVTKPKLMSKNVSIPGPQPESRSKMISIFMGY